MQYWLTDLITPHHLNRIYYGSVEVFDVFNPKSFIYYDYDINNPEVALNEIARLEGNASSSAYDEVMAEPNLLEGHKTIQKYFSLSDESIPDAMSKRRRSKRWCILVAKGDLPFSNKRF